MKKSTEKYTNSEICDRILSLVEYYKVSKGINNKQFIELCGLHHNQITSIKNNRIPSGEVLVQIATKTNVNAEWLLKGKGKMFNLTPSEEIQAIYKEKESDSKQLTLFERKRLLQILLFDEEKRAEQ